MKTLYLLIIISLIGGMGVMAFLIISASHKIENTNITEIDCLERFNLNTWDKLYEFNIENKFNTKCTTPQGELYIHKELVYPHETKQQSLNYTLFINNHKINSTRSLFVDDYSEASRLVHVLVYKNQIGNLTNSANLHFIVIHDMKSN